MGHTHLYTHLHHTHSQRVSHSHRHGEEYIDGENKYYVVYNVQK